MNAAARARRSAGLLRALVLAGGVALQAPRLAAWDHPGHRIVNELALVALPADFPAFAGSPAHRERISFLAGEPDRWSHASELPLRHFAWLEHFLDAEQIPEAGLDFATLPSFRYDFALAFAAGRKANAAKFKPDEPGKNPDRTEQWPGFLPWTITEHYGALRTAIAALKAYEEAGTPDEIAQAQASIVHLMGVMGHFVGDAAQPLHTTNHFNGWSGENPHGYTRWERFHTWIDSGFIAKAGVTLAEVGAQPVVLRPLSLTPRSDGRDPVFVAVLEFILAQNRQVEPLYRLELEGKLGNRDPAITPEARAFFAQQLRAGATMLGSLWLTAWRAATPDGYLRSVLLRRKAAAGGESRVPVAPAPTVP